MGLMLHCVHPQLVEAATVSITRIQLVSEDPCSDVLYYPLVSNAAIRVHPLCSDGSIDMLAVPVVCSIQRLVYHRQTLSWSLWYYVAGVGAFHGKRRQSWPGRELQGCLVTECLPR